MNGLLRTIGIAEKERTRLEAMAALSFVLMAGLAFARSSRDALFIKSAGVDNLPWMYVINGLLMAVFAALYARFVPHFSMHRVLAGLALGFGGLVCFLRGLLYIENAAVQAAVPYAIWSAAQLYHILLLMHFWTFSNQIFDPREARRIFPLIGAAGLCGMIVGSLLTPLLVSAVGSTNVLLVWAGCALAAGGLVSWAVRSIRRSGVAIEQGIGATEGFLSDMGELWRIPLLRLLIFIAFPMWMVAWLIDFQFFQTLDSVYPDQDALAGFLGLFNGLTSLAGLLIQFFLTGRLIQMLGVGGASMVYPAIMTGAAAGLMVRNALPVSGAVLAPRNLLGVSGKFGDETVFTSLHDSVLSLLFNSLPEEKRARGRALLAGVMEPVATSLAGILLLCIAEFSIPASGTAAITAALCIVWMFLALRVRRAYLSALVNNLNSRSLDLQGTAFKALSENQDGAAQQLLLAALSSGDEEMALFALGILNPADPAVASSLCLYLPDASDRLKIAMMNALIRSSYPPAAGVFARQIQKGSPELRALALRGLISLNQAPPDLIRRFLDDSDAAVAGEAVRFVLERGVPALRAPALARLDRMLSSRSDDQAILAARILQETPLRAYASHLMKLLSRVDIQVRAEAIKALGRLGTAEAFERLVGILSDDHLCLAARESLLWHGEKSLRALHAELQKEARRDNSQFKINLIECIGEIASPQSMGVLSQFIAGQPILVENAAALALGNIRITFLADETHSIDQADRLFSTSLRQSIRRAYFSVVENWQYDVLAAESLQAANRNHRLDLLADALRRFSRLRLEAALRLLELISDPRAIRALSGGLLSGTNRARAESLEALEGTCAEAGVIVRAMEKGILSDSKQLLSLHDVLAHCLTRNYPPWIAACAAHAAGLIGAKSVERELISARAHPSRQVQLCAHMALKRIKSKQSSLRKRSRNKDLEKEIGHMDTMMERFLFLRSVPLFSDVEGQDLQWINEITHEQKCRSRQIIFREGDPGESLYIILSGSVRVFKGQKGREITIDILQERDCFGEMAILDQEPRSASVAAMNGARLLVIQRSDFQRLLLSRPRISFSLFKTMSRRVREANARFLKQQAAQ